MKVFGIGFHKTGTTTLEKVLQELGYHVCGPRRDLLKYITKNDYEPIFKIMENFDAFQDNPWPLLYQELDKKIPGSKFILTIRETNKWYESAFKHFGQQQTDMQRYIYGDVNDSNQESIYKARYDKHNEEVIEYFESRKDDLLIIDWSKEMDWERICRFLNKPIPNKPLPHANKQGTIQNQSIFKKVPIQFMKKLGICVYFLLFSFQGIGQIFDADFYFSNIENAKTYLDQIDHEILLNTPEWDTIWVYKNLGWKKLTMRAYLPENSKQNGKVILFFHGGALKYRYTNQYKEYAYYLSKLGYLSVVVEYRVLNDSSIVIPPDPIQDAKDAYDYMVDHAETFSIDENEIVLAGMSAGGFLAASIAYLHPNQPVKPKSLILQNPAFDLSPEGWAEGNLLFGSTWMDYSPLHQIKDCRNIPSIVLSGTADDITPFESMIQWDSIHVSKDCQNLLYRFDDRVHGFSSFAKNRSGESLKDFYYSLYFIEKFLGNNSVSDITTSFEDNFINNNYYDLRRLCCDYSLIIDSLQSSNGEKSLKLVTTSSDIFFREDGKVRRGARKRAEIGTRDDIDAFLFKYGGTYYYELSVFIPNDWIIEPDATNPNKINREIIAQWHWKTESAEESGRPPLSLSINANNWFILNSFQDADIEVFSQESEKINLLFEDKLTKNTWITWKVIAKWSSLEDGQLFVWKNDSLVVSKSGQNCNTGRDIIFKTGIYKPRWLSAPTEVSERHLLIDNIRIKELNKP